MLPGVVRDKKESVEDEASCIVDPAVRGDGAMTSLTKMWAIGMPIPA